MQISLSTAIKNAVRLNDCIKLLKQKERDSSTYNYFAGEEPLVPEYNFQEVQDDFNAMVEAILTLKSLIREKNMETVGEHSHLTIDMILVALPLYNGRAKDLNAMKVVPEKRRNNQIGFNKAAVSEYTCRNFDVEPVSTASSEISAFVDDMQADIDFYNANTFIDIPDETAKVISDMFKKYKA